MNDVPAEGATPGLERELAAAEGRFRRIIETTADAIVVIDGSGAVLFVNPAAEELFGRSAETFQGELFGFPLTAGETTEVDIHPRSGEARVAEMRVVESEWAGKPALLANLRDITDRKRLEQLRAEQAQTEARRREAEIATQRMQLLADAGALLASSLALAGPLERFARFLVPRLADWSLVVLTPEAMARGRAESYAAHADPEAEGALRDLAAHLEEVSSDLGGSEPGDSDGSGAEPLRVTDGEAWLAEQPPELRRRFTAAGLHSALRLRLAVDDQPMGYLYLARSGRELPPTALSGATYDSADLTLARELGRRISLALDNARLYRRAEQASRMRDEFMAKVSHEMRTPLQAILGWVSILRTDGGPENQPPDRLQRAIEVIGRSATSQVHLIEDILDISRIITGKLSLERDKISLNEVANAAVDALLPAAEAKQIHLTVDPAQDAEPWVHADIERMRQVVVNLLSNAVKYTPRQGEVRVAVHSDDEGVLLQVRDDGQGITAKVLPHVFNPFHQGKAEATSNLAGDGTGGLGLGLAIVRQLVEMHGGEVWAESPGPDRGSTFSVRLPRIEGRDGTGSQKILVRPPEMGGGHHDLSGLRLAVVDDQEDACDLLETALTDLGAKVWCAGSAEGFFHRLAQCADAGELPDLLISDISMPGTDGYGLLKKLHQLPADRGGEIPVVALTGFARPEDVERAREAGFECHLAKPVSLARLAQVVAEITG